jgi:HPt (histidine-containing phosphotransfer) domain-containing protein
MESLSPTTAHLDFEVALARAGDDLELLRDIAALFLQHCDQWMTEIREAVARGDAQAVENGAHGLKGSVANFGAEAAVEAALRLEQLGRRRDLTVVAKAVDTLESALAALRPELEALQYLVTAP